MRSKAATEYDVLSQFLDNRCATVVLRLSEMEDILGFKLPGQARVQPDWWANQNSDQSGCWITAKRIATPDLTSQTVTFTLAVAS
jgi:hypothetical protein